MTFSELQALWPSLVREFIEADKRPPVRVCVNRKRGIYTTVDAWFSWLACVGTLAIDGRGYAEWRQSIGGKKRCIGINRLVTGHCGLLSGKLDAEHKSRIPLDNRLANLRAATRSQNLINRLPQKKSGLPRGVTRNNKRYGAQIRHSGKNHYLGTFDTIAEAAAAYDAAARIFHGEFAILNGLTYTPMPDDA